MSAIAHLDWETVACPGCGADEHADWVRAPSFDDPHGPQYRVVRCSYCDLGFLNPRPTEATIIHLYTADYHPYQPPSQQRRKGRHRHGHKLLDGMQTVSGRRMLDYGCGSGWFAQQLRLAGWQVAGMDLSRHAAESAQKNFGIPVLVGTLPHPGVPPQSYDLITLRAVLEHVHDPNRLLTAAWEAAAPGGHLLVTVPNLSGWGYRLFGPCWFGLALPWHTLHFTPTTLARVLDANGWEVVKIATRGHHEWTANSARLAQRFKKWWSPLARNRFLMRGWNSLARSVGRGDDLVALARKPFFARRAA
jgi:2-polyprenyl-3-methyl-5-hydroxy-6-metoxy-1,4-benzoquinol methylase